MNGAPLTIKAFVINLDRRPDRLKAFAARAGASGLKRIVSGPVIRTQAVDGKTLVLNDMLQHLFRNNDFQYRAATIGCALSHLNIWSHLCRALDAQAYLVFEDDVLFCADFSVHLEALLAELPRDEQGNLDCDLVYFGGMLCGRQISSHLGEVLRGFGHGTFAYLITPRGALRLLDQVEKVGIYRALDWFMIDTFPKLTVLCANPPLCQGLIDHDSDIQSDSRSLSEGTLTTPRFISPQLQFRKTPGETIRVKVVANWCSPEELLTQWEKMSQGGGRWGKLELTCDETPGTLDYIVAINTCEPRYITPRTILFQMEPSEGRTNWGPWRTPDPRAFLLVADHAHHMNVCEWHLSKTSAQLLREPIEKTATLSSVTSSAYLLTGHKKRVDLLKYLADQNVPFDLFGKSNQHGISTYRGSLPPLCKDAGLFPYRYTIACENSSEPGYVTEKLWDAILAECLCFYWGCPNLESFIDADAFVRIDLDDKASARAIIEQAIADNLWEKRLPAIRRAKQRILTELSFFPRLERMVLNLAQNQH